MELCVIAAQFFCNPKTILKNKAYYSKINRLKAKRLKETTFLVLIIKVTYYDISYEWYQTKYMESIKFYYIILAYSSWP